MRIAFSGTGNSGKSTLLKSFLYTWKNYSTPEKTYRDVIKEKIFNILLRQPQRHNQKFLIL